MRDKRLVVRVTEYELLQLQQEADKRGVSNSDVVRAWIAQLPKPDEKTISD
ncbi:hypothetical protein [Nostoc favosum]|uniref:CopG family transcriptional regulator n=1 Tax=Nostoc favosum CHAB5714 TaxID=2780399 RepID=A0ABS8IHH2_9NOSO|nr:hypothetical protein [Nostoc favosum]MCC5603223.1 hypothetical protein [Nostoc favosum CHAB5714]